MIGSAVDSWGTRLGVVGFLTGPLCSRFLLSHSGFRIIPPAIVTESTYGARLKMSEHPVLATRSRLNSLGQRHDLEFPVRNPLVNAPTRCVRGIERSALGWGRLGLERRLRPPEGLSALAGQTSDAPWLVRLLQTATSSGSFSSSGFGRPPPSARGLLSRPASRRPFPQASGPLTPYAAYP
jgi:hypothetical protein